MRKLFKFIIQIVCLFSIIFPYNMKELNNKDKIKTATFGAGCFWCVEAVFDRIEGVLDVNAGYTGGSVPNPTYEQICTGKTGHAEVIQILFDSEIIPYDKLLDLFWASHDPTTLNQQGADVGTQYRSVIFYHDDVQKVTAERSLISADSSGMFSKPIVTIIQPIDKYYPAENYHQDYYKLNASAPYCQLVIKPKLKKLFNTK